MDGADLDFAYKYPFSKEAREVIAKNSNSLEDRLIRIGKIRLEEDLNSNEITTGSIPIDEIKRTHILSYVYSRMLVSALNNSKLFIERYVSAEASRAGSALEDEPLTGMMRLAAELNVGMSYSEGEFIMKFTDFLALSSRSEELGLVKQALSKGLVYLPKDHAVHVLKNAAAAEIRKKLPIPASDLPKRILDEAKTVKLPRIKPAVEVKEGSYRWIERLLSTPIADVRHRTVNLVLAPYLTNVKGMSEEDAAAVIIDYIEKCRQINPDSRINSSYIKYQCKYSKSKGSKPLSLERARELYRGVIDFD